MKILGFLGLGKIQAIVGLGMILVIVGLSLNTWRLGNKVDGLNRENGSLELRLQTSNTSVDTLTAALERKNAESRQRAEQLQQAREDARTARLEADRRFASTRSTIDALRAAVGRFDGTCEIPEEVENALEGL